MAVKLSAKKHVRKRMTLATAILLDYVIKTNGGIRAVGRLTGHSPQLINVWIQLGYVPLKHVGKMAAKMQVYQELLNYEGVASIRDVPPFASIINEVVTDKEIRKRILTSTLPRSREKMLA